MDEQPDDDYIGRVFGADGFLAKSFDNYQMREGQVTLAYEVADALEGNTRLMAEAPTGTGKSVAYGVPAAWHASRKEKVVIVTANIALQEQLIMKDLPMLAEVLPWKFEYALAKGLNNYLCKDELEDSQAKLKIRNTFEDEEQGRWNDIVAWSQETKTGDISEIPFETKRLLPMFTTTSDDCLGRACSHYDTCHAHAARSAARKADIAVTNYHLFYADRHIKNAGEGVGGVLPDYKHLIFDEAHRAPDIAKDFFGFKVTRGGMFYSVRMLDSPHKKGHKKGWLPVIDQELHERCSREIDSFFTALTRLFNDEEQYETRFRKPNAFNAEGVTNALAQAATTLSQAAGRDDLTATRRKELTKRAARCGELKRCVRMAVELRNKEDWAYFLEESRDRISLIGKPVEIRDQLKEHLWQFQPGVIMTSATLTTGSKGFKYIRHEIGIGEPREVKVDTPFDFASSAIMVCPPMPPPNSNSFAHSVGEALVEIVTEAGGRTLALFTSYRVLDEAYKYLMEAHVPYTVLKQGQAPRMQLIERFKSDVHSVLLGTESFAEGIDVPGEALSCVVIDRIPFPSPGDPMEDLLSEKHGKNYFMRCCMPRSVLSFKQRIGRLIRTDTDRGVIVCLDQRIIKKNYGRSFIRALPEGVKTKRTLEMVGSFLTQ